MEDRKIVLFATLYHYESKINSLTELKNVETLVLFVDNEDEIQKNSYNVIEKVSRVGKIKIQKEKFDVTNYTSMYKSIDKLVKKFKDYDIYVDISQSVRLKAIALITYFSLKYPRNFKRMTFYAPWLGEIVEIPIFKAEDLSDVEKNCLKYILKNKMFMVAELAKFLNCSITHAYRILDKLKNEKYITKTNPILWSTTYFFNLSSSSE
jgi:uncharacterized membrane protein